MASSSSYHPNVTFGPTPSVKVLTVNTYTVLLCYQHKTKLPLLLVTDNKMLKWADGAGSVSGL